MYQEISLGDYSIKIRLSTKEGVNVITLRP